MRFDLQSFRNSVLPMFHARDRKRLRVKSATPSNDPLWTEEFKFASGSS